MYTDQAVNGQNQTDPWVPVIYEVIDRKEENDNVVTLDIKPVNDEAIDPIKPGQFNMLYTFGKGEIPISVSSLDEHPAIIHTIQNVGLISESFVKLTIGARLGVRGPFGSSWPVELGIDKDIIIVAGGLGLAPLRPAIEHIANNRESYGKFNVLYGTRSPENIFFHEDIISWQADPRLNFLITVDHSFKNWRGHVGTVTQLVHFADFNPGNCIAFVCGPEVMMRFTVSELVKSGITEENIYISMERNMKCGIGHCGHCQFGPTFICKDGPVFKSTDIMPYLRIKEL